MEIRWTEAAKEAVIPGCFSGDGDDGLAVVTLAALSRMNQAALFPNGVFYPFIPLPSFVQTAGQWHEVAIWLDSDDRNLYIGLREEAPRA